MRPSAIGSSARADGAVLGSVLYTGPFHAALRAHQGVRHFSGPATLSSAHAQLVAGMQIIREITCEHKETQP